MASRFMLAAVALTVGSLAHAAEPAFWRLDTRTEEELRAELAKVPEVRPISVELPDSGGGSRMAFVPTNRVKGLPFVCDSRCRLNKFDADALRTVSQRVRKHMENCADGSCVNGDRLRAAVLGDTALASPDAVPALVQMLQAEPAPVRSLLVGALAQIEGQRATEALAMRAMTDPSPAVRQQACKALRARGCKSCRHLLLAGLRYPWAPVRAHAAEALVALGDKEAVPDMVALLDAPEASIKTVAKDKPPALRQLVRVNHLMNCKMCHAAGSKAISDNPVPGAVPKPSKPLPPPIRAGEYYLKGDDFVRADVTFLRQDFSVTQKVPQHGVWPAEQRFDYMVRLAPLPRDLGKFTSRDFWENSKFIASKNRDLREFYTARTRDGMPEFAHLETLRALKQITGKDHQPSEWKKYVPTKTVSVKQPVSQDWVQFLGDRDAEALENSVIIAK
jgi:hypothetical protein